MTLFWILLFIICLPKTGSTGENPADHGHYTHDAAMISRLHDAHQFWRQGHQTFSGFIKARERPGKKKKEPGGKPREQGTENQRKTGHRTQKKRGKYTGEEHWKQIGKNPENRGGPKTRRKKKTQKNRGKPRKRKPHTEQKPRPKFERRSQHRPLFFITRTDQQTEKEKKAEESHRSALPLSSSLQKKNNKEPKTIDNRHHHCLLSFISKPEETERNQRKKQKERTQAEESHGDHCYCLRRCYYLRRFQNQERKQRKIEGRNEALPNQCTNHPQLRLRCQAHQTRLQENPYLEERTPSTYQWSKRIVYVLIGEQGPVKSTAYVAARSDLFFPKKEI